MPLFDEAVVEAAAEFPELRILPKKDSTLMKVCDVALKVLTFWQMRSFMEMTTVVGYTIYTPTSWNFVSDKKRAVVIRHEVIHMRQRRRFGSLGFTLLYLFVPFPIFFAYFRTQFEMEAYAETMRQTAKLHGIRELERPEYLEGMVARFTGPKYAWMWIRRDSVEEWFYRTLLRIRLELQREDQPL